MKNIPDFRKAEALTVAALFCVTIATMFVVGCAEESRTAAYNVSQAAHNFEINRRCIFYNGITGDYILVIEGLLSVTESATQNRLEVIVKTGPSAYKKHYLGLSDNVSYFVEQLEPVKADPFHYRVFFRPTTIIPDIDLQVR
jgi:hypothetical protein